MTAMRVGILLSVLALVMTAHAGEPAGRPLHTYSIVARDSVTGDLGVAVQSHWFSVGTLVPWAEAGVGAVATQSFVDPSYGPLGLELLRAGKSARQALDALLAADPGREVRQVAIIDAAGGVAVHTGARCIQSAGHVTGAGFSVQANLMLNDRIWGAMAAAFVRTPGDLAGRMMSALEAGEAEGGDIRGRQSAALLVVRGRSTGRAWTDRTIDIRVEDHPDPLPELRRLLEVHRAYAGMNAGDLAVERGDNEAALREYASAERMQPENVEMRFWHAVSLVNMGRLQDAIPLFRSCFAQDTRWATLVPRLPASGVLNADARTIETILGAPPAR